MNNEMGREGVHASEGVAGKAARATSAARAFFLLMLRDLDQPVAFDGIAGRFFFLLPGFRRARCPLSTRARGFETRKESWVVVDFLPCPEKLERLRFPLSCLLFRLFSCPRLT